MWVLNLGGGGVDTQTPMGSMVFTVMAAWAQMELSWRLCCGGGVNIGAGMLFHLGLLMLGDGRCGLWSSCLPVCATRSSSEGAAQC